MLPAYVTARSAVSAVGAGCGPLERALRHQVSGLRPDDSAPGGLGGFVGRVGDIESRPLPGALARFDCRNHRLANEALEADGFDAAVARARSRYGADRVAVLVGTSTSGILSTESAYRHLMADGALPAWFDYRHAHNYAALPDFIRERLSLVGPAQCVSTACSSSAKVFGAAVRWLALGLCDAAVVGGVDSLCGTTCYGFHALQVVSSTPCQPFGVDRNGISLGEGAAFLLLEREPNGEGRQAALLGYGESADAWHMSAPHPEGLGAIASMRAALTRAGLDARRIDFTCAHGTATRANDGIESRAIANVMGEGALATSTKGTTGHTLGAAGALSAVIAVLAIEQDFVPVTANTTAVDPACPVTVPLQARQQPVDAVLVNAFGFGGNNCSLVFGATA